MPTPTHISPDSHLPLGVARGIGSSPRLMTDKRVQNAFSVDVEDYFHTEAMTQVVPRENWGGMPSRVERNTKVLLEVLESHHVRGTFFFLGWVAERFPSLVREVADLGHEVACHSYWHHPVYMLSPAEFREDTGRSKQIIEQIAGVQIIGYRAPSFSIIPSTPWAYEILVELGFLYDSSTHPIPHDIYGNANAPREPFVTEKGRLLELPITTIRFGSRNFPLCGGGYFRAFPYSYTKFGINRANRREKMNAIFYIHPWEVDHGQPRLPAPLKSRVRQYIGLDRTLLRLKRLLQDFQFGTMRDLYQLHFSGHDSAVPNQSNTLEASEVVSAPKANSMVGK